MAKYMLLLRDTPEAWSKFSPEEMQKILEKYVAWRSKPYVVAGDGLVSGSGRVVGKKDGSVKVTEGPFSEAKEIVGGFYTVEASSYEEAVQLAMDNPHIEIGSIEVREVMSGCE